MSQENMEIVERYLDGIARADPGAVQALLATEAEIHDFDIPDAGVYKGAQGFLDWVAQWEAAWDSWEVKDLELRDAQDDRVLALFTMVATGRGSKLELSRRDANVVTLQDGRITRIEYYNEHQRAAALEAAGLSE